MPAAIYGTDGDDDLTVTASSYSTMSNQVLFGLDGNDILRSGAPYSGYSGDFHGGRGDDTYILNLWADVVIEEADEGIDTIYTVGYHPLGFYTLPPNCENLVYTGIPEYDTSIPGKYNPGPHSSLRGNALDNRMTGGAYDDHFRGGGGNNHFDGGGGWDSLYLDDGGNGAFVDLRTGTVINGFGGSDTFVDIEEFVGGAYADVMIGDELANRLHGMGGSNEIDGGGGNDWITGDGILRGGDGNDILSGNGFFDGGTGNDYMVSYGGGGAMHDTYVVDSLGDRIEDHGGFNTVILNLAGTYEMKGVSYFDNTRSDTWISHLIANFDGTTVIANHLHNDLRGSDGSQTFRGLGGDNAIDGGAGVDTADYSTATQILTIDLNEGRATRNGFGGADTLANIENVIGTGLGDTIVGSVADNRLEGGGGADVLAGLGGNDVLVGGAGGPGGAANELLGGLGDDTYYQSAAGDSLYEAAGEGTDTVFTTLAYLALRDNFENLTYDGAASFAGAGNGLANILRGGAVGDQLSGLGGGDFLHGLGGDDSLSGGAGAANTLFGGAGNDLYYVEAAGDSVVELAGEGADMVLTALSQLIMAGNVEALVYTGAGSFFGLGNAGNNSIVGGSGADALYADSGADLLIGGSGADELHGGAGADQFRYLGGETGLDRILDFQSGADRILLSGAFYSPTGTVAFVNGSSATSASSAFLYDAGTGILSFDADGNGAGAAVQIAQLNMGMSLAAGDFGFF
jgi:trimeric autotransporter adhesin